MMQVIQTEIVKFEIPKEYLPSIIAILQSGVLRLKGEKATLHFDNAGNLKIIEYPHKFLTGL
jgi:hypothetical protein